MENYLDIINNKFESRAFVDWYIDDVFYSFLHDSKESKDQIIPILDKYFKIPYDYRNIVLLNSEADIIYENYQKGYNVLIRAVLDFLLSNSYLRSKSILVDDCIEYSDLFFENIFKNNKGYSSHTFSTILRWTLYKFPNEKGKINQKIYSKIINGDANNIGYFSIADNILKEKETKTLFDTEQYKNILNKYFKNDISPQEVYFYMHVYKDFLKYFSKVDKKEYRKILKKYCNFIFYNIKNIDDHTKQIELQKVRQYMDILDEYQDEDYRIIDEELDRANKAQINKLEYHSIQLSEEQSKQLREQIENNKVIFERLSNANKIRQILCVTAPLSLAELKEFYDDSKKGFSGLCNESILDKDGRVINFGEMKPEEDFSLKSASNINLYIEEYFHLIFGPFCTSFKMDNDAKRYINGVISNSKLVDVQRIKLIADQFITFFEGDYQHSVYNIILELEESVRYYFKKIGLNIMKRDGSGDYIGLSNVFNDYKNNGYRDELLKIIDEDYYFTLKWFLTDKYGFNLKNRISHSLNSIKLCETTFAIYSVIQIFRLYWGFQNN